MIVEDDLGGSETQELVKLHLEGMFATSPPENVFALDLAGLKKPGITFWSAWIAGRIAGMGALKDLGDGHGELKSMRTHPDFLRRGVGSAILEHIIAVALNRGMKLLSLETGRGPAFEPALALYLRRGFVRGAEFSDYRPNEFSQFLHLNL